MRDGGWPRPALLAWLSGLAGLVLLLLGLRVRSLVGGLPVDDWSADALVPRTPSGAFTDRSEYRRVAAAGSQTALTGYVAAVGLYQVARRQIRTALVAGAGPLVAVALAELVLKPGVGRTTALSGALSFPSGTATATAAMATSACLLAYRSWRGWAALPVVVGLGIVVAVDIAVVALSWHYATDAVAGTALGVGVVTMFAGIDSRCHRHASAASIEQPPPSLAER